MPSKQFADFWTFIGLLSDNGVLEHVLIIGSWAEYIYDLAGMLPGFDSNLRTLDIDLLVTNLRLPNPPISIPKLAIEAGYTIDTDRLSGATMIYTPGFMEIEFIILSRGSGSSNVLKTNLGVNAQIESV